MQFFKELRPSLSIHLLRKTKIVKERETALFVRAMLIVNMRQFLSNKIEISLMRNKICILTLPNSQIKKSRKTYVAGSRMEIEQLAFEYQAVLEFQ